MKIFDGTSMEGTSGGDLYLWTRDENKNIIRTVTPCDAYYEASDNWDVNGKQYLRSIGATHFVGMNLKEEEHVYPVAMIGQHGQ